MFKWLENLFAPRVEPEFEFVKNLCDQNTPRINSSWSLGYLYEFELQFNDGIRIELEYNIVRNEWDSEIWSSKTSSFLFYHDCLDPTPIQTINYLIDRYNLLPILDKAMEVKRQNKAANKKREEEIIKKYTS
jgi:hypothetical protein